MIPGNLTIDETCAIIADLCLLVAELRASRAELIAETEALRARLGVTLYQERTDHDR